MCAKNRSCCSPPQQEWPQPWPGAFLSRVEMVHVREPFQPQLLSPLRWKSVPWSARNESFGDGNLSNSPHLAVTVTHCQPELDLRNQILVNGYWNFFFVLKFSFAGKIAVNTRYLRKGKVGSDLFVYVPHHHSRWPSLVLWWDLKSRVLKMLFVSACVPEQYGVKSS